MSSPLVLLPLLFIVLLWPSVATSTLQLAKPNCPSECGNIHVPYPFGFGSKECYRNNDFKLTCDKSNNPAKLIAGSNIEVLYISSQGQVSILSTISYDCYNKSGQRTDRFESFTNTEDQTIYTVSDTENNFTALGCDTISNINGFNGRNFQSGCSMICSNISDVINGSCTGIGCCQTSIPKGFGSFNVSIDSYQNHTQVFDFNPCSYGFVVQSSWFNFSVFDLFNFSGIRGTVPVVYDWAVDLKSCEEAVKNQTTYACKNSKCVPSKNGLGYSCTCFEGYEGNPYLDHGCQGVIVCIIALPIFIWLLYWAIKKRRLIKLKEKFFQQNGGMLLQQQIALYKGVKDIAKIFTIEGLKMATNNFHESQIVGQGGFGTVYKGTLPSGKVVAIKRSKTVDKGQIIQFINEVDILSQINHRHVVKLLGCCLETEVPLLVYEFVSNGTLYQHIHSENKTVFLSLENRLRIAAETADALAYLHSSHSVPIFHRDVKSSNILLDDKYSARVSDFGASRLVPLDQTQKTTILQGTHGYLDPECLPTGQLTDKSDVYSFGVVLVELLTGKKPILMDESGEWIALAMYFVSTMKDGNIFHILDDRIVDDEGNRQQLLIDVAEIARSCLEERREDRPAMKEVAKELDSLKMMYEQPFSQHIQEETDFSLGGPSTSSTDPAFELGFGNGFTDDDDLCVHGR
ncbi:putative wall-associated receptor kinase-like 16 isoform X2 [Macadamia integrifolia]|uniref:putative wall-associated receptor kinase-like 16 isoform X2 n=1 Tax=Macadamia integrifolia TaxID=60698 RepID=UPI001C4E8BFB|nr:putative wall-associated receptor kinase-like 16 isoform X2 [Macadamia integrifolia]